MRGLFMLLLLGPVLSIRLTPSVHMQTPERESETKKTQHSISKEDHEQWSEYTDTCNLGCFQRAASDNQQKTTCAGLDESSCKTTRQVRQSYVFMYCTKYCLAMTKVGKRAYQRCAQKQCKGQRMDECATKTCSGYIDSILKAESDLLEKTLSAQTQKGLSSKKISPMGARERWYFTKHENYCKKQGSHLEGDSKSIDNMCSQINSQAIKVYEACVRIKCDGHRDSHCLNHVCKKDLNYFYLLIMKRQAKADGARSRIVPMVE